MANLTALASASSTLTGLGATLINTTQVTGITPMQTTDQSNILATALASTTSLFNPKTFLFNYNGEENVSLQADITDHFVEQNFAIQDHIARKPVTYSVEGFIAELNDVAPTILQPLKLAASLLTTLTPYTPALSVTAILAYNTAFQAYQIAQNLINLGITAASLFGVSNQNQQQAAFTQFEAYFNKNTLFQVQTPWRIYPNMAIQSLRAVQGEDTRFISSFEITFKQINFTSSIVTTPPLLSDTRWNNANFITAQVGASQPTAGLSTLYSGPNSIYNGG